MAAIEASLRLEIAQYQAAMAKARGEITRLREKAKRDGAGLGQNLFGALGKVAAISGGTLLGRTALTFVVDADRMTRAMTTLEGSSEAAAARMAELREASKLPGIGFQQAVAGDVRLRAVGISAETSKSALIEFGNALALAGGSAADLDGVILALGQIASKGKVSAEEINQIAERVPQIRKVMMDVFGTADTEAIQKMGISSEEFIKQTINGFSKLDRASAGLDESLSDIAQSGKELVTALAKPIVDEVVPAFALMTSAAQEYKDELALVGTGVANLIRLFDAGRRARSFFDEQAVRQADANGDRVFHNGPRLPGKTTKPAEVVSDKSDFVPPVAAEKVAKITKEQKEQEREIQDILKAQGGLRERELRDRMEGLSLSGRVLEIQRQIQEQQSLISTGMLNAQSELQARARILDLRRDEKQVVQDILDETRKIAAENEEAAARQRNQEQALADFKAELDIIRAQSEGRKELAAQLQKGLDIEQEKRRLMEQANLSEEEALKLAKERVNLEQKVKDLKESVKSENNRYDSNGMRSDGRHQIKGYSRSQSSGMDSESKGRSLLSDFYADQKTPLRDTFKFPGLDSFQEKQKTPLRDSFKFPGLDAYDELQTRKNADQDSPLKTKAMQNQAAADASGKSNVESLLTKQLEVLTQGLIGD